MTNITEVYMGTGADRKLIYVLTEEPHRNKKASKQSKEHPAEKKQRVSRKLKKT